VLLSKAKIARSLPTAGLKALHRYTRTEAGIGPTASKMFLFNLISFIVFTVCYKLLYLKPFLNILGVNDFIFF